MENKSILESFSREAIKTINSLWSKEIKTFWRHTSHPARLKNNQETKFYPTVSLRCIDALLSVFIELPSRFSADDRDLLLLHYVPRIVELELNEVESSLDKELESSTINEFTLSVYIQAFSKILQIRDLNKEITDKANSRLIDAIEKLLSSPIFQRTSKNETSDHPFILFHINCALSQSHHLLSESTSIKQNVLDRINEIAKINRSIIYNLLSKYQLGTINPSDSIALSFCAATLSHSDGIENRQYLLAALNIVSETQDSSGCWPLGRLIRKNKDVEARHLEISTYEVSWVLSTAVWQLIKKYGEKSDSDLIVDVRRKLALSCQYVSKSYVQVQFEGKLLSGWCSDQPYDQNLIESWTTSNVLRCLASIEKLDDICVQQEILKTFVTVSPDSMDWPNWLKWHNYLRDSEVDLEHPILKYINDKVVDVIKDDPLNLPSAEKRSVSLLLFGPPGTSKTTIAKALAHGLNWPVVILSPGDFIEGGLESIERLSQSVFSRLMKLSKVVVLFDECDELFRHRAPSAEAEQTRSITAFITASMLPKLQELHDRGKLVFVVCTNNFGTIDPAIKRGGRIDHIIGVGPPDSGARKKIILQIVDSLKKKQELNTLPPYIDVLIEKATSQTDRYIRSEIQRAIAQVLKACTGKNQAEDIRQMGSFLDGFSNSLTINESEYSTFQKQKKDFSHVLKD
jgi:hypothetical protein